jgi:hypothetical protein
MYRMLRIGDCLDLVLQIAAEVPQRIARVGPRARSLRPAETIVAHRMASASRVGRIIIVAGVAIFFIEVKKVDQLALRHALELRAIGPKMRITT